MHLKHLIIGNGAAGVTAAEKIRELNSSDEITIVTAEEVPAYTKPMLPDYIGGKVQREKLFIRDTKSYENKRINLFMGDKAQKVDIKSKKVILKSGAALEYDKLLIAIGGIPFIPPIEGLDGTEYFSVNSLNDAEAIKSKVISDGRALIVGAGLTGIEVAFALKNLGMEVVIVEREERILPLQLDLESSKVFVDMIKKEGISLMLGKTLSKITGRNGKTAELTGGQRIDFDMIAITIGTRPCVDIIKESGINYNRGIVVDEYMKTSVEDVYAAGDVAEAINPLSSEYICCYIWPNAMAQGKCAAFGMIGQHQEFSNSAGMFNSVQLRDVAFISMGMVNPNSEGFEILVAHDKDNGIYQRLIIKNNIIKGMVLIGDTKAYGLLSGFIRKSVDISDFKEIIMDKDFVEKYKQRQKV